MSDVHLIDAAVDPLDLLLQRMQRSRDFPALSETIRTLNGLTASSNKSVEQLAAVIVRDYALTHKVLKVVNSAFYAGFAGKVGTISRAIVVLGIEPIRALAASLMLFDQLAEAGNAARVRALIGKSMFGALLAREAAVDAGLAHGEEAFLAAMFHNLGELLVAFYLPNEDDAVLAEMARADLPPSRAQVKVLGASCEQLGISVGRHWNLPQAITHSMQTLSATEMRKPIKDEDRLCQLACLASEITDRLADGEQAGSAVMEEILERYRDCVEFDDTRFAELLKGARSEYRLLAENLATPEGAPAAIRALAGMPPRESEIKPNDADIAAVELPDEESAANGASAHDPEPVLIEGLQEVTAMLAEGAGLNQVAQVMLETLYRALDLRRVALCLRDVARREYAGRLGFGDDTDEYLRTLRFGEAYERDVFHVALQKKTDVHIADLAVGGAGHGIPDWYSRLSPSGALLFLPLVVQDRPVGCIIAEHAQRDGLHLEPGVLRLVRALRNQLALGLQLRRGVAG